MSNILKVTLQPVGPFFFGGEIVFGGEDAQNERRRSYLVHTRVFPQQTSLLGMLREQILAQNGLLLDQHSTQDEIDIAQKRVGETGFTVTSNPPESFGVIKAISSLLCEDEKGNLWQPAPADDVPGKDAKPLQWEWDGEAESLLLRNFDAKEGLSYQFGNKNGDALPVSRLFKDQAQVGITVTNRQYRLSAEGEVEGADKEAFYRQTFLQSRKSAFATEIDKKSVEKEKKGFSPIPQFSFVFWVELTDDPDSLNVELSDALVTLGGERSTFRMIVSPAEPSLDFDSIFDPVRYKNHASLPEGYERLVLMSDTYLPRQTLVDHQVFAAVETVSFRFFSTTLGKTWYYHDLKKKNGQWDGRGRKQSKRYTLLRRGGVLYVKKGSIEVEGKKIEDNVIAVTEAITQRKDFRQIGYNYFKKA